MSNPPSASIVIEMDNAAFASEEGALDNVHRILGQASRSEGTVVRLIVAYASARDGAGSDPGESLRASLGERAAGIKIAAIGVPDGRYYELKNAGAAAAKGEIVVFADSDITPREGWLEALLRPFRDETTVAACGSVAFRVDSFAARALALAWYFPPPDSPLSEMTPGGFFANNVAFRTAWFREHPFPPDDGFKNACVELADTMRERGDTLVLTDARVEHPVWSTTVGGLLWRAGVEGRDGDRKAERRFGTSRRRRVAAAVGRCLRMIRRILSRAVRYRASIRLQWWEAPLAIVCAISFAVLIGASQLGSAIGLVHRRREAIPESVKVS